jgi:hypothetical protein
VILHRDRRIDDTQAYQAQAPLRAGVYGYLSETYDAAESVSAHLERGTCPAEQRGWAVVATFKDDGIPRSRKSPMTGWRR